MRQRIFGRLGWRVGELGYGMWGMGEWTGSEDRESFASLELALSRGVNFFDTAQSYGDGHSEQLLGLLQNRHRGQRVFAATKVPPKNRQWPSKPGVPLHQVFPREHVRACVDASRANLGVDTIELLQLHVWEDDWLDSGEVAQTVSELKREGSIRGFGISLNRWQPGNGVRAVRSGLVDSVQVVYNVFDQAAEDELFPACRENAVAVVARVPLDEGALTGSLALESTWPEADWRGRYFSGDHLALAVRHAEALRPLIPEGCTMAEIALRFVLSNPDVSVVIPGMRKARNVEANLAAVASGILPPELLAQLRRHRWDRTAESWGS